MFSHVVESFIPHGKITRSPSCTFAWILSYILDVKACAIVHGLTGCLCWTSMAVIKLSVPVLCRQVFTLTVVDFLIHWSYTRLVHYPLYYLKQDVPARKIFQPTCHFPCLLESIASLSFGPWCKTWNSSMPL